MVPIDFAGVSRLNLLIWCFGVLEFGLTGVQMAPDGCGVHAVVATAIKIAHRDLPWLEIVEILNGLREVAEKLIERWLKDV